MTAITLFLAMATAAMAADPCVGTWKLNVAKSKFAPSAEANPKEETVVVRELDADTFDITMTGTRTDGSHILLKWIRPQNGGVLKSQTTLPKGESMVYTVIDPSNWYFTVLHNGKQVRVIHSVISKDGKTLSDSAKGTDAKGKPYEALEVFDKQ
jgi:hypothetical protein